MEEERRFNRLCVKFKTSCEDIFEKDVSFIPFFDVPKDILYNIVADPKKNKYGPNIVLAVPNNNVNIYWYHTTVAICSCCCFVKNEEICVYYFGEEHKEFVKVFKKYGNIYTKFDSR